MLFRAAAWMRAPARRARRPEVFEAGKPWDQADADVCEAIDFCEYYGREALRLDAEAADRVQSPPGEENRLRYRGKGPTVVIAPWNFPLAIPCGMAAAALVAGNPVILKPAEQTPGDGLATGRGARGRRRARGRRAVRARPRRGRRRPARRAPRRRRHRASPAREPVGLSIVEEAAVHRPGQRHIKRVVAEMGGKNAVVVDADADPDQAVPGIVLSAFGYAGQKCSAASRCIVVGDAYDAVVERLAAATARGARRPPRAARGRSSAR